MTSGQFRIKKNIEITFFGLCASFSSSSSNEKETKLQKDKKE
jgi:hypothetical protein